MRINLLTIAIFIEAETGIWWLERADGEAVEITEWELDKLLSDYYNGKF